MQAKRLQQIDFLRGIAILLVLLRHKKLFSFTVTMGWIGVDLFFVLSGFLVSGLLFKEYQRFGNIKPGLFLIRRGYKIYPIYYLTYFIYVIPFLFKGNLELDRVIADLFFFQNYYTGWGYTYAASWSLAVEEHFYFGLALLFWILINSKYKDKLMANLGAIVISLMMVVLVIRIVTVWSNDASSVHNITSSHLRIDSLLMGVLVSYFYYFKLERLKSIFFKNTRLLFCLSLCLLLFTPFVKIEHSVFIQTFGFVFLYIAFAVILVYFLLKEGIVSQLNATFTKAVVDLVSKIGYCSYSIYVIHTAVNYIFRTGITIYLGINVPPIIIFFSTSIV
ncbi:MAG: hypothetical protein RLZZ469_195, partial [Bacteroidota bacterium]